MGKRRGKRYNLRLNVRMTRKKALSQQMSNRAAALAAKHFLVIREPKLPRTDRHNEFKNLITLEIIENEAAGNCLFLSVLQHLQYVKYHPLPGSAMEIRLAIVQFMIDNWEDYHHALWNYEEEFQDEIADMECTENVEPDVLEKCHETYRNYMSTPSVFGTHVELAVACKLYDFQCYLLTMHEDDPERLSISIDNDELDMMGPIQFKRKCFLLFSGDHMNGHFEYLKPFIPKQCIQRVPAGHYKMITVMNKTIATFIPTTPRC